MRPSSDMTARCSYELARSEDLDESDATMLTAEDELPLTLEELFFGDILNEKAKAHIQLGSVNRTLSAHPQSWRDRIAQRLCWWHRSSLSAAALTGDYTLEEGREDGGLLHTKEKSLGTAPSQVAAWLVWPLPSWTHRFFGTPYPDEPHRPTDYLDGLRGVASLFVFFNHYLLGGMGDIVNYSFGAEDENWNALQLPFIRSVFSGAAMVAIFFVISGYVLSARCISSMRAGKHHKVYTILTSMTFRRAIRLFVPSIASSSLSLWATYLGFRPSFWPEHWSAWGELSHYGVYLNRELFRIWNWDEELDRLHSSDWNGFYAGQLWTIPREFNCSMIVFLLLLATIRCTTRVRFTVEAFLISYLLWEGRWDVATFAAGIATAEANIILDERRKARAAARAEISVANADDAILAESRGQKHRRWWRTFLGQLPFWAALIFGWYLSGLPYVDHEHTPGYDLFTEYWQTNSTYKYRFWLAISGMLVTCSVTFLPAAQRFFTTPIARYLGKLSYALYLVHAFLNSTLRWVIWDWFTVIKPGTGKNHNHPLTLAWWVATIIYVACVLWCADVFWRMVDKPAVRLAKWVEDKCFVQETKQ